MDDAEVTDPVEALHASFMRRAIANAATARLRARPNPWVGAVLVDRHGLVYDGATHVPGGAHAEKDALTAADEAARGGTLYCTLEPCGHHGRTAPCTDAIVSAGVSRVVIGILDPDPKVSGEGVAQLAAAGVDLVVGVEADRIERQLAAYITHRRTGRPRVILKLGMTLDGHIAAPDGTSRWITGAEARADAHRLRAESDAIVVGAGTVRADDPALTVRAYTPSDHDAEVQQLDPWRIVLGDAPDSARMAPFESWTGSLEDLLDELGRRDMLQVLVEGGAAVAGSFHRAGLVDEYCLYLAPALMGGSDARPLFSGSGAPTISEVQRGRFASVERLGNDIRIVYLPGEG